MDSGPVRQESFDGSLSLSEIADRASKYNMNLDNRVDPCGTPPREGSTIVYLSNLRPGGMTVAIKTLRSKLLGGEDKIAHALQEIRLRTQLRHQNVLPLLGITTKFLDTLSIVSQWMEKNAHDYVQDESVDPRPLIIGIAHGLQYLHNLTPDAVLHGDLKGLNVSISDNGEPLLTNFGLSWLIDSSPGASSIRDIGGPVNWMAPEIFDVDYDGRPTAEGDVWAFAMTVLELFTRKNPFHDHTDPAEIRCSIKKGAPDRPSTCNRMTDPWWNILVQCWEVIPSSRPNISQVVKSVAALGAVPSHALEELIEKITQKSPDVNRLDGQIHKDDSPPKRGGYAIVYRGTRLPGKTKVAVKTTHQWGPSMDKKIIEEVNVWYKLRHPNILPLLGITTQFDSTVSIISPWMEKGNAHDYVQDTKNDPRPLIQEVAQGLYYMHSSKIIHGDVKGFNVLISDHGQALLTDFGFSCLGDSSSSSMSSRTHGHVRGTINWIALEILHEKGITYNTDVWSFGMTALELFTRDVPFPRLNPYAVMKKILDGPPSCPCDEDTCHRLTNEWWDLCTACWNREPSLRPTMAKIVENITTIMGHSLDRLIQTGLSGAISKPIEVVDSTHNSAVCPGALLSTWAITAQSEAAGTTNKPPESLHAEGNSQVNPRSSIDLIAAVQEASSTTELLESPKVEGNSTADANTQPILTHAPSGAQEDTSATPESIYSSHMPPVQANTQPSTMEVPSKGQEAVNTLTIFTCQEKPLQSPVELVFTFLPEGHSKLPGGFSPVIWQVIPFLGPEQKYSIDIPMSMGVSTRDELNGAIHCDVATTTSGKTLCTFNQTKVWEQHAAASYMPDEVGITNQSGIPKAFAMCALSADGKYVPLVDIGYIHRSDMTVKLARPVMVQAYTSNKCSKVGTLLPPDVKASALFPNDGVDTRISHNNFRLWTDGGRHFLEPVQV